jgi:hypothetical protein
MAYLVFEKRWNSFDSYQVMQDTGTVSEHMTIVLGCSETSQSNVITDLRQRKKKSYPQHESNGGRGGSGINPFIFNPSTRWRWVFKFMPWFFTPGTLWMGGWVGPTEGMSWRREDSVACVRSLVPCLYTLNNNESIHFCVQPNNMCCCWGHTNCMC